jgi:hypothetical protein
LKARDLVEDWREAQMPYLFASRYSEQKGLSIRDFMPTAPPEKKKPTSGAEIIARFRALAGK